jgi:plasmid maintenance system antidote protein VapI
VYRDVYRVVLARGGYGSTTFSGTRIWRQPHSKGRNRRPVLVRVGTTRLPDGTQQPTTSQQTIVRSFDSIAVKSQAELARRIHVAQSHLSALERGEKEQGAAALLAISQEFEKSVDWLLTGKTHVEPKKRVAKGQPKLGQERPK